MCAVPFKDLYKDDLKLKDLQKIQRLVKERIPTGVLTFTPLFADWPVLGMLMLRCTRFPPQSLVRQGTKTLQWSCRTLTEVSFSNYALKTLPETLAHMRHTDAVFCAGRESHKTPLIGAAHTLEDISHRSAPSAYVLDSLRETRALKQLGTLGGGNHFLEVSPALMTITSCHGTADSSKACLLPNKSSCQLFKHTQQSL